MQVIIIRMQVITYIPCTLHTYLSMQVIIYPYVYMQVIIYPCVCIWLLPLHPAVLISLHHVSRETFSLHTYLSMCVIYNPCVYAGYYNPCTCYYII